MHHKDRLARERWSSSPAHVLHVATPPGSVVDKLTNAFKDPEGGWDNFAVLTCTADYVDWMFLRAGGYRRAMLRWHHTGWRGDWVAP